MDPETKTILREIEASFDSRINSLSILISTALEQIGELAAQVLKLAQESEVRR